MKARRHQVVARALRGGGGENGSLKFENPGLLHAPSNRVDDPAAQHDVCVQMLAPQIEEPVFEPDLLRIFLFAEHRHGQLGCRAKHLDLIDVDLDLPVGKSGFSVPPGRRRTLPSTRTTHSERSVSASLKALLSGSATTCERP